MSAGATVEELAWEAKEASRELARAPSSTKNAALKAMAQALRRAAPRLLEVDAEETAAAAPRLDARRLGGMAAAVEALAALPDPVGKTTEPVVLANGLRVRRRRGPVGVVAVVCDADPASAAEAAGLCVKSGNACVLAGAVAAHGTLGTVVQALRQGMGEAGLPLRGLAFVEEPDPAAVARLLKLDRLVDLAVARGGPDLTAWVRREAAVPVLSCGSGPCHVYVDGRADLAMALSICLDGIKSRGSRAAARTVLVHSAVAESLLVEAARAAGVSARGCPRARSVSDFVVLESDEAWGAAPESGVARLRVVARIDEAIAHVARHGAGLAEAIVTRDRSAADLFQNEVDAGAVFVNASTLLADGPSLGLGATMALSSAKWPARGPVGVEGLTCEKLIVDGAGQEGPVR